MLNWIDANSFLTLLAEVEELFETEPPVLEVFDKRVLFIGDLHGDWEAAREIIRFVREYDGTVIFLGDYVDRGDYSIEILQVLFEMKRRSPRKIILLRGNHETISTNSYYGFKNEVFSKFKSSADKIYIRCNEVFAKMPIAVLINNGEILALHGGIPIESPEISELKSLPKNDLRGEGNKFLFQILWNDPDDRIKTYAPSPRGPGCYLFGWEVFNKFTEKNNINVIIRAHTYLPEGYRFFFNNKLLSIFSVLNYVFNRVNGKIAEYRDGELKILNIK